MVRTTDIDKLVNLLKEEKYIQLKTLASLLSMDEEKVKNYLELLENENLVEIEYKLTKIYVKWLGKEQIEKRKTHHHKAHVTHEQKKPHEGHESVYLEKTEKAKSLQSTEEIIHDQLHDNEYKTLIYEIDSEQTKLAELKEQKAKIYRDKLLPLEAKLEAEIKELETILVDYQKQLLSISDAARNLPKSIAALEQQAEEKKNIAKTLEAKLLKVQKELEGEETALEKDIDRIEAAITNYSVEKKKMEQYTNELKDNIDTLENSIKEFEVAFMEKKKQLGNLLNYVDEINSLIAKFRKKLETLKQDELPIFSEVETSIGERFKEMKLKRQELIELKSELNNKLNELKNETNNQLNAIKTFEERVINLRDNVMHEFKANYTAKIKELMREYALASGNIMNQEQLLEEKIMKSKQRIRELMEKANEMLEK